LNKLTIWDMTEPEQHHESPAELVTLGWPSNEAEKV